MRKALFIVSTVIFCAVSASAMAQQNPPAQGQQASTQDPNETICKAAKAPIGSRIPAPPECHTRAQWEKMQEDSQKELDRMQTTGRPAGNSGG